MLPADSVIHSDFHPFSVSSFEVQLSEACNPVSRYTASSSQYTGILVMHLNCTENIAFTPSLVLNNTDVENRKINAHLKLSSVYNSNSEVQGCQKHTYRQTENILHIKGH